MPYPKGHPRPPGSGRARGTPNRTTARLRAVVAQALEDAGGPAYLAGVARDRPELFVPLVRKVLPRDAARAVPEAAQDAPGATSEEPSSLGSPSSLASLAPSLAALRQSSPEPDIGGEAA
jgi:hypothetical protein